MQTTKSAPATNNNDLKEAFALWEKKGAKGVYYSGKTSDTEPVNIVGFITTEKKNEKQPDLRVYVSAEKDAEKTLEEKGQGEKDTVKALLQAEGADCAAAREGPSPKAGLSSQEIQGACQCI